MTAHRVVGTVFTSDSGRPGEIEVARGEDGLTIGLVIVAAPVGRDRKVVMLDLTPEDSRILRAHLALAEELCS